ncbi:MAG TPA: hypothetical protein VNX26_01240 [Candidatus Acidoferrum sp.]|jgi:hypothetical protein|nr:hypothetical protein [Candidatus Acidoferrum sp.]
MTRHIAVLCGFVGIGLAAALLGQNETAKGAAVRLQLNEVQAGSMASEQYCTVVFADRRFHSERASRRRGKDTDRRVYEGVLSEADWNTLSGIIDSEGFRALNVPRDVPPLVMQDAHAITISVARDAKFQNMEFLDNKSRKPYESQLKPLLQWWKSFRGERVAESKAAPDARCALDSTHAVFSQ